MSDARRTEIMENWNVNGEQGIIINDTLPVETLEQDNTAPALIWWMNQVIAETTITVATNIDDVSITVLSAVGLAIGQKYSLLNVAANRVSLGEIVDIIGNVIYLDSPMDFAYPIGSPFAGRTDNLAVDGSVTTQRFIMRGVDEDIPGKVDITRIIITCLTDSPINLSLFGDLPKLIYGLLFRRENGFINNIFNVKSNLEIAGLTFDFDPYTALNPSQGQNGFVARLTFNGQSKMGVVQRIGPDDEFVVMVQDDLSDLVGLFITLQGHFVEEN